MAKFKFQLEAVEKVRIQAEEKALETMSIQQKIYQEKINYKKELIAKKSNAFLAKNEMLTRDSNVNEIRLQEEYISGINQRLLRADQAIVRARRFLEQAMREYIKARKERKMVDRIKEKAVETFKINQNRLEQKNIDDLISMRSRLNHALIDQEEELVS